MKNTWVIGDIHGALKALKQLLKRLNPKDSDKLIFIGDYVDGWSQSAQVIEFLIGLNQKMDCIFIKGNHDAWCEEWLETGNTNSFWLSNGGTATIESYEGIDEAQKALHLSFFKKMLMYFLDDQNRLFVHAGFTSLQGVTKEVHITDLYWDRTLWEMAVCIDPSLDKSSGRYPQRLAHYLEIYIGHTPTLRYGSSVPMQAANVWNVDTGAGFSGRISALDMDTKKYWQSDDCSSLYPGEKGRNK